MMIFTHHIRIKDSLTVHKMTQNTTTFIYANKEQFEDLLNLRICSQERKKITHQVEKKYPK